MNVVERGRLIVAITAFEQAELVDLVKQRIGLGANARYMAYTKDTPFTPEEWAAIAEPLEYVDISADKLVHYEQANDYLKAVTVIPFYRAQLFDDIISSGQDLLVHIPLQETSWGDFHELTMTAYADGNTFYSTLDQVLPELNDWLLSTSYLGLDRLVNHDALVVLDLSPRLSVEEDPFVQHIIVRFDVEQPVGDEDDDVLVVEEDEYTIELVSQTVSDGVYGTAVVVLTGNQEGPIEDDVDF